MKLSCFPNDPTHSTAGADAQCEEGLCAEKVDDGAALKMVDVINSEIHIKTGIW